MVGRAARSIIVSARSDSLAATGMPPMMVEQVAETLLVGHAAGHTASIVNAR
jgi:hypothetical protein